MHQFVLAAAVRSTHRDLAPEGWRGVGEAPGALRVTVGQFASETFPATYGRASRWSPDAASRICIPLKPSESYLHSPGLFPPSSHVVQDSVLWIGQEKNEPLGLHPAQLGKLGTHSYALRFPCRRLIVGRGDLSWHQVGLPWGRNDVDKVKRFLLPSPLCPDLYFFSPFMS